MSGNELFNLIDTLPKQVQRQDSLQDQLVDLLVVANKLGMYDAADYLNRMMVAKPATRKTEDSWAGAVDCQGGSFTDEEIRSANEWK